MARSIRVIVDVDIRPGTARDLPALATWSGHVESTFRPALQRQDRVLLVAHANGRFPIGHVIVDLAGMISHLLVLAGFRDQGLGTGLIEEAERLLRDAGAATASLAVEKVNVDAIRLYERLGYATEGETVEAWEEPAANGTMKLVEHPSWVMRKKL